MRRRAWDILCVLSLLVALLAAGLWARSVWWASDHVELMTSTSGIRLFTVEGCIGFLWVSASSEPEGWLYGSTPVGPHVSTQWWPVGVHSASLWIAALPAWMVIATTCGVAVASAALSWRRAQPGHCPACGYDLRGTSGGGGGSGGACPECGAGGAGAG